MTPISDHELMQRTAQGDSRAFGLLVARWQSRLSNVLGRIAGPVGNDDLCQEVWLRVHAARARYQPQGAFSTWLYRIALNVVRDHARRHRRWLPWDDWFQPASPELPPDDAAVEAEEHAAVRAAVARLPDKLREAIVLKHFGELTFAEVAQVLDQPLSTVKSRVETGLLELRRQLPQSAHPRVPVVGESP